VPATSFLFCSFEELFKPGVHYEPVRYDLSDLVKRGQDLLSRFNGSGSKTQGMTPLQQMTAAAASKALETFNFVGQLDTVAYTAQKVRETHAINIIVGRCKCPIA
jgi:hypothetical protein